MNQLDDRELLQEQLYVQAKRQRRDFHKLPSLLLAAVRMVWRTNRGATAASVAIQLGGAVVASLQVLLASYVVATLVRAEGNVTASLLLPLVALAVVTLVGGLSASAGALVGRQLGMQVERQVTSDVLDVATRADLVDFDDPVFYNQLNRVLSNVPMQPFEVVSSMSSLVGGIAGGLALLVALVALSPLIALLVLAAAPPMWLLARRSGAAEFDFAVAMTVNHREREYIQDLLTRREGAAEARAYATAGVLRGRFDSLYDSFLAASAALIRRRFALSVASSLLTALAATAAMAVIYLLISRDALTLAQATSGLLAIRLLTARLGMVFGGISVLFQSSLFLEDFDDFMTQRGAGPPHLASSREQEGSRGELPRGAVASVHLSDVFFRYPGMNTAAVEALTLDVPPGQIVALVGENGSGKTTLARLIAGLYRPSEGTLSWRSAEGDDLDVEVARDGTTLVLQEFARYQFTVHDNVSLGRPELPVDDERVRRAATDAGLAEVVAALPDGLHTRLSRQFQGGHELSLGQWQRLALARAFYRGGSFVVFDEPAASLDPRAEARLYETVRQLLPGRTVILITHRMLSVRGADRIIVMDHGRIVEDGNHAGLMEVGGMYSELVALQADGGIRRAPSTSSGTAP